MGDPSQPAVSPAAQVAVVLLAGASLGVWWLVVVRLRRGLPVLPYEPRRPVPWRASEVLILFLLLEFVAPLLILWVGGPTSGESVPGRRGSEPIATDTVDEPDVQHPIVDLLGADPGVGTWLLCGLVAVVVAPLVEEFMYRLLLQGWLEAEVRRARRWLPGLSRLIPGAGPIVLVSLLFALRHFRWAAPPIEPELLRWSMILQAVWSLLTLGFGLLLLRIRSGATAEDLGFSRRKFLVDVRLGLLAFAAITAPLLLLQYVLTELALFEHFAADPIPLFLMALVLGTIYYRTHRIVPVIVLHTAFNATGMALAWLSF